MKVDVNVVESVVQKVLAKLEEGHAISDEAGGFGVYKTMDEAVAAAAKAQRLYLGCSMMDRARFIRARSIMEQPR